MTFEQAINTIESHGFAAEVNIASDLKTFVRVLGKHPAVTKIRSCLSLLNGVQRVNSRIEELLKAQSEVGFEHPNDAAIAAYVWIIASVGPELAHPIARLVPEKPEFWWARKVAKKILADFKKVRTDDVTQFSVSRFTVPGITGHRFFITNPDEDRGHTQRVSASTDLVFA